MIGSKTLAPGAKCILMQTDLAREMGRSAAQLLQQIHYWMVNDKVSGIVHDGKKWIINSYEEWANDLGIVSKSTIQRSLKKLKDLGLIEVNHLLKEKGNRTNCISLKYDQIEAFLSKNEKQNKSESSHLESPHRVKMILSSSQNESIIYSNKITNKEILITKSERQCSESVLNNQSEQVQKIRKYAEYEEQRPNHPTIVQDMIDVWNKIFPKNQTKLTKELSRNLNSAYKNKFNSDLKLWKNYCLMIESSNYLTSDQFSLYLDWAIKFKTMEDIENGRYGCKNLMRELERKKEIESLRIEIFQEIDDLPESIECKNLRKKLLRKNVSDYSKFLRNISLYQEGKLFFFVTEDQKQIQNIRRTYPIDIHGLGNFEKYKQLINSLGKPTNQESQNDTDFELMVINSSNESETIKAKRRQLCEDFGIETYIRHFRILKLIDIGGSVFVKNKEDGTVLLSDKIKNILHNSLCNEENQIKVLYQ